MYTLVNKHISLVLFEVSVESVISDRKRNSKIFNNQFNSDISFSNVKKSAVRKSFLFT